MKAEGQKRGSGLSGLKAWWAGKESGLLISISRIAALLLVFALVAYFVCDLRECDI